MLNETNRATVPEELLLIPVLILLCGCQVHTQEAFDSVPGDRPNLLFILADDVGREILGSYGGTDYNTPNLDRLAGNGLRFRHAYSTPKCHPTRLTLMTGRYPFRYDVSWGGFPDGVAGKTLGRQMRRAGYRTAVAGKWQLTLLRDHPDHPDELGFDRWSLFGWHEGPRYWEPHIWEDGTLRDDTADRYGPNVYTDFLIDFMEENRNRPFFAFYSMALPHDVSDDFKPLPPYGPGRERYESYPEMIQEMDERVGRLIRALELLDLRRRTLVIFTSDNGTPGEVYSHVEDGEQKKEPVYSTFRGRKIRGGKGTSTDRGTRVPMIASLPGSVPSGEQTDALVYFSDFLPTFMDIAGADPNTVEPAPDGVRFLQVLNDPTAEPRSWIYNEGDGKRWVQTKTWKKYFSGPLYHVAEDPDEKHPIEDPEQVEGASEAETKLNRAILRIKNR